MVTVVVTLVVTRVVTRAKAHQCIHKIIVMQTCKYHIVLRSAIFAKSCHICYHRDFSCQKTPLFLNISLFIGIMDEWPEFISLSNYKEQSDMTVLVVSTTKLVYDMLF